MSVGSLNNNSLFNNPTLLGSMLQGINVQGLQQALQSELYMAETPLAQISAQMQTLTAQAGAWSKVASQVGSVLSQAQTLQLPSTFTNATTATVAGGTTAISVSGGTAAPVGTYNVVVNTLEQNQQTNSNWFSSETNALNLSGSLTLSFGSQSEIVNVVSTDSLQNIATAVNQAAAKLTGVSVSATVVPSTSGGSSGYQMAISANGTLGVTSAVSGLSFTTTAYQAASYTLNGVANTANSNTIQNAVAGVTLNLLSTGSGSFSVENDVNGMTSNIQGELNGIISLINLIQTDTGKGAVLEGNPTLLGLQNELMSILQKAVPGLPANMNSLTDLGLSVSTTVTPASSPNTAPSVQLNLSLNSTTLSNALTTNWSGVQSLIQGTGGIADQVANLLQQYNGTTGIIGTVQSSLTTEEQSLTQQQYAVQQMVQQQQQLLQQEFNNMLAIMEQSSNESSYLSSIVNNLNNGGSGGKATGG
ncbi:MAG: flagellar filament capping protein FliD [Thermaerobacter sp.]|nr:flagellar filament capping protein FliD [Thermaerobacter sp.]